MANRQIQLAQRVRQARLMGTSTGVAAACSALGSLSIESRPCFTVAMGDAWDETGADASRAWVLVAGRPHVARAYAEYTCAVDNIVEADRIIVRMVSELMTTPGPDTPTTAAEVANAQNRILSGLRGKSPTAATLSGHLNKCLRALRGCMRDHIAFEVARYVIPGLPANTDVTRQVYKYYELRMHLIPQAWWSNDALGASIAAIRALAPEFVEIPDGAAGTLDNIAATWSTAANDTLLGYYESQGVANSAVIRAMYAAALFIHAGAHTKPSGATADWVTNRMQSFKNALGAALDTDAFVNDQIFTKFAQLNTAKSKPMKFSQFHRLNWFSQ